MERISFFEQISRQIISMQIGEVFIISDFSDLADNATIRKVLSRLEEDKKIRRIMWGIYYKSGYNDFPEKYIEPHPDKVAHAIARNFGWTIIPCGDTALNMLGISTQVPVIWLYVSNGTYRKYNYGNTKIEFKRTTNKEISKFSYKTALIIQAIKALGREKITNEIIMKIGNITTKKERENMFKEAKYVTSWIYDVIKDIYGEEKINKKSKNRSKIVFEI